MSNDQRCPAVRLADEMAQKVKEMRAESSRLAAKHTHNVKCMRKVAEELKLVLANPNNVLQGADEGKLDWCIAVLNAA